MVHGRGSGIAGTEVVGRGEPGAGGAWDDMGKGRLSLKVPGDKAWMKVPDDRQRQAWLKMSGDKCQGIADRVPMTVAWPDGNGQWLGVPGQQRHEERWGTGAARWSWRAAQSVCRGRCDWEGVLELLDRVGRGRG